MRNPRIELTCVPLVLMLASLSAGCAFPHKHSVPPTPALLGGLDAESSAELDNLVKDVCSKAVVILGEEPHHGGGRTLEIKVELVRRLIDRCGFDAVYFESSGYEFHDLNRRLAAATSAPEQLADAIGGLWSISNAVDPLVTYLYAQASAGRIRLAGLDAQIGSATSGYEQRELAHDLSRELDEARRSACDDVISRRTNWGYDDQHPNDSAEAGNLARCFGEAADAARPDSVLSVLARATQALLTSPPDSRGWDTRERQLAGVFRWHQRHAARTSKAIVWTANVHALRHPAAAGGSVRPVGDDLQAEYGDRLASIAFSALGGAYGRGAAKPVPTDGPASLEARALAGGTRPLRYLSKAALVELAEVEASPLDYEKAVRADWSLLFDGMVVLREEKPLSRDRPTKPRFTPVDREQPRQ